MRSAAAQAREYDVYDPECPSRRLLALIAQRWSILIVHAIADGTTRPADLGSKVGGISRKMLTQTLRDLQRAGLVHRNTYDEASPNIEYTLTEMGQDLAPLLATVCEWVEEHVDARTEWTSR